MSAPAPDQKQRDEALDVRRSYIVQAPAGSGKTTLLVDRFIALLKDADTVQQPEEIVAITFTKKAAAEMRKRVLEKLKDEKLSWSWDELGQRLKIKTIDSFCAELTRQMPVTARFGAQPTPTEDAEALYQDAARRTLALLDHNAPVADNIARLLKHLDNEVPTAEDLLVEMLKRRDQWLRLIMRVHGEAREVLEATLSAEYERALRTALALHPHATLDAAKEFLVEDKKSNIGWKWRQRADNKKGFQSAPAELMETPGLLEALAELRATPPARYSDTQWEALDAIVKLLPSAVAELRIVFAERGACDFVEITQGALAALGTDMPTDLLLKIDASIKHLLVDEFQDTSVSQWELLKLLTLGWQAGDGRTVFAVGDPMQSIYRFREADVSLFLRARRPDAGIGEVKLKPITLQTNFRSQAGIVDWVNTAFTNILPQKDNEFTGAVRYPDVPALAAPDAQRLEGEAVRWHGFFDEDNQVARKNEAQRVVEIIRQNQNAGIKNDIAILVRGRGALDYIVPALKAAGIRFVAEKIDALGKRQVVQDLLALTRALIHPADRIAWLALLRAPYCGLALNDLSALAESTGATLWESMRDHARLALLSHDGRARLARVREVLMPALAQRLRDSLRGHVESVWLALGGPACVTDAAALQDAAMFFEHLSKHEVAGDLSDIAMFEQGLEKLYAAPDAGAPNKDAIKIMTIHGAKGLEFDTVIVPGLNLKPPSDGSKLLRWKEHANASLLLAPIQESGGADDPIYDYLKKLESEIQDNEAARLLYVAATRTKSRLHLLACVQPKEDKKTGEKSIEPTKRSLLAQAWSVAEQALHRQWQSMREMPTLPEVVRPDSKQVVSSLKRLPLSWQMPASPSVAPRPQALKEREADDIAFSWAGETARHVGSVVHRWLQRIADDEMQGWDEKRVASLRPTILRELTLHGVAENEIDNAGLRTSTALTRAVNDARGRWLLGPQRNARNEHRITALMDGAYQNFVIDRMFEDEQGRIWIVDYKTSDHQGADVDGFLDMQRERYAKQLQNYADALGIKAKLGLYFPLLAGWREWS